MPIALSGFYAICDLRADEVGRAVPLAGALLDGAPTALQLRMKDAPGGAMYETARALLPLCRARGVPFVVNDRLDVALAIGADAVHLGQEDLPLAEARRIAPGLVIGVSTHDEAQAEAALAGGADYLGFGPCFPTRTKANPDPVVGLGRLARVAQLARARGVPVVAIGGIGLDTVGDVARAGAHAAALIAAVNGAPDVAAAARAAGAPFTGASSR